MHNPCPFVLLQDHQIEARIFLSQTIAVISVFFKEVKCDLCLELFLIFLFSLLKRPLFAFGYVTITVPSIFHPSEKLVLPPCHRKRWASLRFYPSESVPFFT